MTTDRPPSDLTNFARSVLALQDDLGALWTLIQARECDGVLSASGIVCKQPTELIAFQINHDGEAA